MPQKIILIRHGQTTLNAKGKLIGWQSDVDLTEHGKEQALRVAKNLKNYHIDMIYHSDLRRTTQTASIISNNLGVSARAEFLLRERNLGLFDGKSMEELRADHPDWVAKFYDHADTKWKMPDGESLADVHTRFKSLVVNLHDNHKDQVVLLVSHSGYVHTVLRDVFGFFPVESFIEIEHDSITILEKIGTSYSLTAHNLRGE